MKYVMQDTKRIAGYAHQMKGVFLTSDLSVLLQSSGKQLFDRISYLVDSGVLTRAVRGVYLAEGWRLEAVAARLNPESYITGPTVLAERMMIGTVPSNTLYCVKTGMPRSYAFEGRSIRFYSLQRSLFFGFEPKDGCHRATPEKALLDTLYFYLRGERYFFDLFSDVNLSGIQPKRFEKALAHYKNPKFRRFASDYLAR